MPRLRRNGGLFRPGDVVPVDYFTEAEIADLTARGKVTVEIAEPEPVEIAEPEPVEIVEPEPVEIVEPEPVEIDIGGEKKHSAKRWRKK